MTATILQHSDQIVTAFAKKPRSFYGSAYTKEVALVLAGMMNKESDWAAWPYVCTIAEEVGCSERTVRSAIARLEALKVYNVERREHEKVKNWNLASVYTLGEVGRAIIEQSFTQRCKPVQGSSSNSFNTDKVTEEIAPAIVEPVTEPTSKPVPTLAVPFKKGEKAKQEAKQKAKATNQRHGLYDPTRVSRTDAEWTEREADSIEHNRQRAARLRAMLPVGADRGAWADRVAARSEDEVNRERDGRTTCSVPCASYFHCFDCSDFDQCDMLTAEEARVQQAMSGGMREYMEDLLRRGGQS